MREGRCSSARFDQRAGGCGRKLAGKIGVGQHEVGRLAAQFLVHALDGVGRRLGHHDPGAGRTGEADHVDIGMAADRRAHAGAIALDQVEHAGRHAGGIHHFGQDRGAGRAFFRRLEHHGVARGQGRRHFQRDLVEWPVPGRDQADDADRFIGHLERAVVFHELEILERGDRAHEAADARADLGGAGKAERRAHFLGHGVGKVGNALLVFFHYAAKQGEPFLARGAAERLEGARAAATAASTSAGVPSVIAAHGSSVAGLITSWRRPPWLSTHWPSM
jgi:hypothetical protein